MFLNNKNKNRINIGMSVFVLIFLSVQFFGFTLFIPRANAQGLPVMDALASSQRATTSISDYILKVLYAVGLNALMQGVSYMARKVAYDTASYIGSGFKGQKPLIFTNDWGDYLIDTAADAGATAIDQFGAPFGLDLCGVPDIKLQAQIQVGLRSIYDMDQPDVPGASKPTPTCEWNKLQESWSDPENYRKLGDNALNTFNNALDVKQTDFGVTLAAMGKIDRLQAAAKEAKLLERMEGQGYKAVKGLVSGDVKTPAAVVQEETKALTAKHQGEITYGQISGVYGSGAVQVLSSAASVFLNTLVSKGLTTLFTKGIVPDGAVKGGIGGIADFYASAIVSNKKAVQQAFSYLFSAVPKKQVGNYDILTKFAACPQGAAELNNCVIDEGMRQAINRAKFGNPLTIKEAISEGLLKANWSLVSPLRIGDNTDLGCYLKGYCYSNIQKLRKVRIFPLGFEIAVFKSDPDNPWTLKEVVDGYNDCFFDEKGNVIYSQKKPFCRLIDPNWVIRLPETRCESLGIGPQLINPQSPDRREECLDVSTCISEGPNGECIDEEYYAYCTKEKNTWFIGSKSCSAQFNTCKTYTDISGVARSYLSRTLDFGQCTAQDVGCRAYSLEQKNIDLENETWVNSGEVLSDLKKQGRSQILYVNNNITNFSCPSESNGCTALFEAVPSNGSYIKKTEKPTAYLQKAPDYLGCYDAKLSEPGVQWPTNVKELKDIKPTQACSDFASVCIPEETACQLYSPIKGGLDVPGIIGSQFSCSSQCVGYDAFKQGRSFFEKDKYPMYFIPSSAKTCGSADVGCEEFTSLEPDGSIEYYSKIKYCEKPDGSNEKTFYSWEGDATSGYILRVHKLLQIDKEENTYITQASPELKNDKILTVFPIGSPAYSEDAKIKLEDQYNKCNETNYNNLINNSAGDKADPDCRALYDDEGKVYYRLLANTVTVSLDCKRYRRTDATFEIDSDIKTKESCGNKKGSWDDQDGQCNRCMGGGEFNNGSCVYSAITDSGESISCSPEANKCRKFTGSAGNNTAHIVSDAFEPTGDNLGQEITGYTASGGVGSAKIIAEAVHVGLHSLQVNATTLSKDLSNGAINPDVAEFYEISFWAKGGPLQLTIDIVGGDSSKFTLTQNNITGQPQPASLNNDWKNYRFGPVRIPNNLTGAKLVFTSAPTGQNTIYFLDNLELSRIPDVYYLIKDSWKDLEGRDVPLVCDANPDDAFPGQALGCTAYGYKDSNGVLDTAYATGFEKLCREEAIGCAPFFDSHNTVDIEKPELAHVFNLECSNTNTPVPKTTECALQDVLTGPIENGTCNMQAGETSCTVEHIILDSVDDVALVINGSITASTIIVPEDNIKEPIYLANRAEFQCSAIHQGCQKIAVEDSKIDKDNVLSYSYESESYVLNNPDMYLQDSGGVLCTQKSMGCSAFGSGSATTYFKDPKLTSNKLCEYRTRVNKNGNEIDGWFRTGIEGDIPCYDNYIEKGGTYGIWSNKSVPQYQGFVGECGDDNNQCTELVDPADKSFDNPKGKPHYVIFNDSLQKESSECNGDISLKEGCVLFDRTEFPSKSFNSTASYDNSKKKQFELVPPVIDKAGQNDSNTILKVQRNRSCSEWLSCKTSVTKIDKEANPQKLCYEFKACDEIKEGICTNWVDEEKNRGKITEKFYVERDASWFGADYTGYSLFNKFQLTHYDYINVDGVSYIVYKFPEDQFPDQKAKDDYGCSKGLVANKDNWEECGYDAGGRCVEGACVYPIDGLFPKEANKTTTGFKKIKEVLGDKTQCKAYPEVDSPFPQTVLKEPAIKIPKDENDKTRDTFPFKETGFTQANVCQSIEDCSCEYVKVKYKGVQDIDYWSSATSTSVIPTGVCSGSGEKDGIPCTKDTECGPAGSCGLQSVKETHLGISGYCLEYDISRRMNGFDEKNKKIQYPCLTWLPIDVNPSGVDQNDLYLEAGYDLSKDAISFVDDKEGQVGGTVFCRRSTNVGSFQHEENSGSSNLNPFKYFTNLGTPLCSSVGCGGLSSIVIEGETVYGLTQNKCSDGGLAGYGLAVCMEGKQNFSNINDAITTWASATFGLKKTNLTILRTESGHEKSLPAENNAKKVYPGKLLPIDIWDGGIQDDGMEESFCNGGYMSGGTEGKLIIRHPPRLWETEKELVGKKYQPMDYFTLSPHVHIYNQEDEYWQMERSCSYLNQKVEVSGMTGYPGPLFTDSSNNSKLSERVYRSPFEATMNLRQLKKVYFVPISFPWGVEGNTPLLLSKNLFIDFEKINNTINKEESKYAQHVEPVPSYPDPSELDSDFYYLEQDYELLYKTETDKGIINTTQAVSYVLTEENIDMQTLNKEYYNEYSSGNTEFKYNEDDERNFISKRYIILYYDTANGKRNLSWIKEDMAEGKYILTNPFVNEESHQPQAKNKIYGNQYYDLRCDKRRAFPYFEDGKDTYYGSDSKEGEFGNNNWFAIGMDFNKDGEFLGYVSRYCNQSNNSNAEDGAINLAVLAEIKDSCVDFVQVHDSNLTKDPKKTDNKAWTDKVWQYAKKINNTTRNNPDLPLRPFGTLNLTSNAITNPFSVLAKYTFENSKIDGYPLACMQPILSRFIGSYPYGCSGLFEDDFDTEQIYSTGDNFSNTFDSAQFTLRGLFAKTFRVVQRGKEIKLTPNYIKPDFTKWLGDETDWYDSNNNGQVSEIVNGPVEDVSGEVGKSSLIPPQIYSLNPFSCFKNAEIKCTVGEVNNITINGRNGTQTNYDGQPGADEDPFNIGAHKAIIAQKTVSAVLDFFAFADNNRMPIKRVMVNWNDGSYTNTDKYGRYKNKKPFCDSTDGSVSTGVCKDSKNNKTQLTCKVLADCPTDGEYTCDTTDTVARFGNAPRACEDTFFEFVHSYTCPKKYQQEIGATKDQLIKLKGKDNIAFNELPTETIKLLEERNLTVADKVCVFKPKVQVLDNWGWCNGSCNGEGNTGCYNDGVKEKDGQADKIEQCKPDYSVKGLPWTPYQGLIVIIPNQSMGQAQ